MLPDKTTHYSWVGLKKTGLVPVPVPVLFCIGFAGTSCDCLGGLLLGVLIVLVFSGNWVAVVFVRSVSNDCRPDPRVVPGPEGSVELRVEVGEVKLLPLAEGEGGLRVVPEPPGEV